MGQVHELLASLINETSQTSEPSLASFIEWFYVHAWNVGARTTALEGMELQEMCWLLLARKFPFLEFLLV